MQGEEKTRRQLMQLHQLAMPLIAVKHPEMPARNGEPSTLDILCMDLAAAEWLTHIDQDVGIARTSDTQRITYIRFVPGFNLNDWRGVDALPCVVDDP